MNREVQEGNKKHFSLQNIKKKTRLKVNMTRIREY